MTMKTVVAVAGSPQSRHQDIALEDLVPSKYQPRDEAYNNEEDLQTLAHLIEIAGLDPVPEVRPHPGQSGKFEIIKGHRRVEAIGKFLRWKTVPCDIVDGLTEDQVLFRLGQDNSGRRAFYPYEKGKYYRMWSRKLRVDEIAQRFGINTRAVSEWIHLADDIDYVVDDLTPEIRNAFIVCATREIIDAIKKMRSKEDRKEACKLVADGATVEDLRDRYIVVGGSTANAPSGNGSDAGDSEGQTVKNIRSALRAAEKARDYEALRHIQDELRKAIEPTLDRYIELEQTVEGIENAKEAATIRVVKPGTLRIIHQVDSKGNGLCIHQAKNNKKPIVAKFKIAF